MSTRQGVAVTAAGGSGRSSPSRPHSPRGAPFGAAAWGGATPGPLPADLRVASAVAAGVWVLAAIVVLSRAGSRVVALPAGVTRWGTWILVGVLAVGAVMNVASPSPWERHGWGPFSLVLAGRGPDQRRKDAEPDHQGELMLAGRRDPRGALSAVSGIAYRAVTTDRARGTRGRRARGGTPLRGRPAHSG
jgi:hypothetical protein